MTASRGVLTITLMLALLAAPLAADAQPVGKVYRIGFLSASFPSSMSARLEAFQQGLRELGYAEGKSV
jgi:putative ABC transport system substrate-binding protein